MQVFTFSAQGLPPSCQLLIHTKPCRAPFSNPRNYRWRTLKSLPIYSQSQAFPSLPDIFAMPLDTPSEADVENKRATIATCMRTILECLGEDPDRPGLQKTPERYAESMLYLTAGYGKDLKSTSALSIMQHDLDRNCQWRIVRGEP